jgi:pimeloyl-ACP methyl ester carboxylesterase
MNGNPLGPMSHTYYSQRLRLHYVDWGNPGAPLLLLIHGTRDHCRNWDWVARALRDDYHVIAPDLRGHGDSQWVIGSNYAMVDYVYDVAQLLHQRDSWPVTVIAHSLGGSIGLQYAGVFPDRVRKIIAIEGLGPSPRIIRERGMKVVEDRMQEWIMGGRKAAGRVPRRYPTLEEALRRMQEANPHLSDEWARHLTVHGTNQNEDGTYSWKFDNYTRRSSPYVFNVEEAHRLWGRISCPMLLLRGSESFEGDYEKDGRVAAFQDVRVEVIEDAGHWLHHDQLDRFLELTRDFLRD